MWRLKRSQRTNCTERGIYNHFSRTKRGALPLKLYRQATLLPKLALGKCDLQHKLLHATECALFSSWITIKPCELPQFLPKMNIPTPISWFLNRSNSFHSVNIYWMPAMCKELKSHKKKNCFSKNSILWTKIKFATRFKFDSNDLHLFLKYLLFPRTKVYPNIK